MDAVLAEIKAWEKGKKSIRNFGCYNFCSWNKKKNQFYAFSTEYCFLPSHRHMAWHFFMKQRITFSKLFAKFCHKAQTWPVKTPLSSTTSENNIQIHISPRTFEKFIKSPCPWEIKTKQARNQDKSKRQNKFKDPEHCYTSNRSTDGLKITLQVTRMSDSLDNDLEPSSNDLQCNQVSNIASITGG